MNKIKNKKTLIAIIAMFFVVTVGTIAYFVTDVEFSNKFNIAIYKTTTTENFESPTNWEPGDEITKTITTTNEGTISAAVRVTYKGVWVDEDGNEIAQANIPDDAVITNLDNTDEWTKEGDYYYYNYVLAPGETTSSFIKSVTLNPTLGDATTCTIEGNKEVCESANTNLQGVKYVLTVTKETIQSDVYKDVWNTSVDIVPYPITYVTRQNAGKITTGDLVRIGETEEFYVVSSDAETTVLLAHYNLNVGNNIQPGEEGIQNSKAIGHKWDSTLEDSDGNYPATLAFSDSGYWSGKIGAGLTYPGTVNPEYPNSYLGPNYPYVYDSNSNLYPYVENYKIVLEKTGLNINKARLLTVQEVTKLGCSIENKTCASSPAWVRETSYWLGSVAYNEGVWYVYSHNYFYYDPCHFDYTFGVRPAIEIKTSKLTRN